MGAPPPLDSSAADLVGVEVVRPDVFLGLLLRDYSIVFAESCDCGKTAVAAGHEVGNGIGGQSQCFF